ncbi:ubiquitin-binding protein cue5 [Orbilia javanica]|uniref:Ubiquitin-binding protein cue5 n=1 Tax=Orbilia javanica TaxID=47235 RepID=A0AAN8N3H2_9PEZI
MSGAADKDTPPVVPPKERSPSPDDGLLREEPLEEPTKPLKSIDVPTVTAPPAASQTVTAPPAPTVESVAEEGEEAPPPKPPRPVSKFEQNVATLAEAFPDIDVAVIKAVLTASGGKVEPAFNALLGMSDPSAAVEIEEPPPPQPPRPRQQYQQQQPRDFRSSEHYNPANIYNDQPQPKTSTPASQMEADELYARQLAEHYGGLPRENRQGRGGYGNYPEQQQQQQRRRQHPQEEDDRERSFFDDDLPVIRDNLKKGFLDTQTKFNKFITDFSKKIAGDEEEGNPQQQQQQQQQYGAGRGQGQGQGQRSQQYPQQYPQRYSSRRSGDGYDADPEVIQGDFSHLELRDNSGEEHRRRPLANPNLFGSNPTNPTGAPRKTVGFADQSEEDLYRKPISTSNNGSGNTASNSTSATGPAPTTGSKWAPLTTMDPTPMSNDPFQLADSDDEHDNIQTTSTKTGPQETGTKTK